LQERQQHISRYLAHEEAQTIMKQLSQTFDINKLISTILYRKLTPTPFIKLRSTLGVFFASPLLRAPHEAAGKGGSPDQVGTGG